MKEMKQLHDRDCFGPIDISTLTPLERKRALESFMFLVEKKSKPSGAGRGDGSESAG